MSNKYVTMIRVRRDIVDELKRLGRKDESYSQILERLIEKVKENENTD